MFLENVETLEAYKEGAVGLTLRFFVLDNFHAVLLKSDILRNFQTFGTQIFCLCLSRFYNRLGMDIPFAVLQCSAS